jgi:hypothetical protein
MKRISLSKVLPLIPILARYSPAVKNVSPLALVAYYIVNKKNFPFLRKILWLMLLKYALPMLAKGLFNFHKNNHTTDKKTLRIRG